MKVAFLLSRFPCLSETFILNQVRGLLDHKQKLLLFSDGSLKGEFHALHSDEVKKMKRIIRPSPSMADNQMERIVKSIPLIGKGLLTKTGATLSGLNISKYGLLATSLRLLHRQSVFLSAPNDFDIIHAHYGYNGILACILASHGLCKGPIVTTFYGHDVRQIPNGWGDQNFNQLQKKSARVLVLSEAMKTELASKGFPEEVLKVHHLGIDCEQFSFKARSLKPDESPRLISVARLVPKKGLKYGIQAVAKVAQKFPNIRYEIIGGGDLQKELKKLIEELGVQKNIELLGWRKQDEVVEALNNAHLFLCPSVTTKDGDQEGTPTVLMEAHAQGLPVISTFHAGIPEVVTDGKTGVLVEERDVDGLENAILRMIDASHQWGEFGKEGRRHINAEFNTTVQTNRLLEIYEEARDDQKKNRRK